jgi:hypothetical protein
LFCFVLQVNFMSAQMLAAAAGKGAGAGAGAGKSTTKT